MKQLLFFSAGVSFLLLVSCGLLQTKIGPKAADAINKYCLQPQDARLALRAQVNSLITPNSIAITCSGDQ